MKKRRVMIGTPCYDGRLDVWYVNSLMNTVKQSAEHNVEIIPIWVSFDALLQKARNDTVQLALIQNVDDLIWIDSDIEWDPAWIFKLLNYPVDVVGGTYPKKGDKEQYVVRLLDDSQDVPIVDPTSELIEVSGLGTGFVRWSRRAVQYLWDISESYVDDKDGQERRFIFDVVVKDAKFFSEDIYAFQRLLEGGFKIWLDPKMTCNHTGHKKWQGDYAAWIANGFKPTWENAETLEKMSNLARYSIDHRPPINQVLNNRAPVRTVETLIQPGPAARINSGLLNSTPRRQL